MGNREKVEDFKKGEESGGFVEEMSGAGCGWGRRQWWGVRKKKGVELSVDKGGGGVLRSEEEEILLVRKKKKGITIVFIFIFFNLSHQLFGWILIHLEWD